MRFRRIGSFLSFPESARHTAAKSFVADKQKSFTVRYAKVEPLIVNPDRRGAAR